MRRARAAALAGLLLSALWVSPAQAYTAPTFTTAPQAGKVVSGSAPIRVESTPSSLPILGIGLEKVFIEVTIVPRSGTGGGSQSLGKKEGGVYEATWNAGASPYNGAFDIVAVATSNNDSAGKTASVSNVLVNNPPDAPKGVKATLQNGVPAISWSANSEKDILDYKVLRSAGSGGYTQVYRGDKTSFLDSSAPHSQPLTYKVSAVRKSPVTTAGLEATSGATSPVTVPAPPAPETPGAEGGGGEPEAPTVPGTNIITGEAKPPPPPPSNPNFGRAVAPIVRAAPGAGGPAFEETLPYEGTPPERFSAAGDGDPSLVGDDSGPSVTNPALFIVGGLVLLVASGFMWRASRRLLRGGPDEDGVSPSRINYPQFRISRS